MSNLGAFLAMIAISEGTEFIGNHGYDCIVGSTAAQPHLFTSYADHPRIAVRLSPTLISTAAGRYQILEHIYDAYKAQLHLPDFSPASQDVIATQLIRERHALEDVLAGHVQSAIVKCSGAWASLPGNDYGQHENTFASLQNAYTQSGGQFA